MDKDNFGELAVYERIKVNLVIRKWVEECELDLCVFWCSPVAGYCVECNEISGSSKAEYFFTG